MGISVRQGSMRFRLCDNSEVDVLCRWFTNLDFEDQTPPMVLTKTYNLKDYPNYDNYNAIEVGRVTDIPKDYDGIMGVPITFLDKYCPKQFEIIGATESEGKGLSNGLWKPDSRILQPMVGLIDSINASLLKQKHDRPYIDGKRKYFRVLIRRK